MSLGSHLIPLGFLRNTLALSVCSFVYSLPDKRLGSFDCSSVLLEGREGFGFLLEFWLFKTLSGSFVFQNVFRVFEEQRAVPYKIISTLRFKEEKT